MFKEVDAETLERFRIIYHQTTNYSNPIIESVLYQNKGGGMFYWGDLSDGNYLVFHRTGFGHINFNPFDDSVNEEFFKLLDSFIKETPAIPSYLLLYHTPEELLNYWKNQDKQYFKIRRRRRYQIDERKFLQMDRDRYRVPDGQRLVPLQACPWEHLATFDLALESKFYDSKEDFLKNSFGFVTYDQLERPVAMSYLMCLVGRKSECDLKTIPEFRGQGHGYVNITNYVRESLERKIDVGWDCFVDNHTNKWVQGYGYTHIIREYDFVSFLK